MPKINHHICPQEQLPFLCQKLVEISEKNVHNHNIGPGLELLKRRLKVSIIGQNNKLF
jgi:hypothetical protein